MPGKQDKKPKVEKLSSLKIKNIILEHLRFSIAKTPDTATKRDWFFSVAYTVRDLMTDRWMQTMNRYYKQDTKRIYYLSLEFLMGQILEKGILNLGLEEEFKKALKELAIPFESIKEQEADPALGNGGLGRLAACFLDSIATLSLPGYGYGIRYEYGMFFQRLHDGFQVEQPDNWLRYGNPWEFPRPEILYPIQFGGHVAILDRARGEKQFYWKNSDSIMAMAYDIPIPGNSTFTVNNMRLWAAKSSRDFDLDHFNRGDYIKAVENKNLSENLSKVLYPDDTTDDGKKLRFCQEYFFVSGSLQDIIRRHLVNHKDINNLAEKTAIQLNDTHPALAIPELMRLLMDKFHFPWEKAWNTSQEIFSYTNHTLLPEALETWPIKLFELLLPRHLQIIYEINHRFLKEVRKLSSNDQDILRNMSIISEEGEKHVRMANLAIVGSHKVNGVAKLHTHLMKTTLFSNFDNLYPKKIINKTNGITPRRWLNQCNPALKELINTHIGTKWVTELNELKKLIPLAKDKEFQNKFRAIKFNNKLQLAKYIKATLDITVYPELSMFDVQVKRIHEYKRQLLNLLHVITLYNQLRKNPDIDIVPRTIIFSGKAAPGYAMAKLIIKLINSAAGIINNDRQIYNKLKLVFIPNYDVSNAMRIIPAAELSEQISTAGMEASGTGNMKLSLNGALTIGTLDGANIEIKEEVGDDNIFIFGLTTAEVKNIKEGNYNPWDYYNSIPELKEVIDMISNGFFSDSNPDLFKPIVDALIHYGDNFMLLADYASYINCQKNVSKLYKNMDAWTEKAIINVANMGKFSSDRTIMEYAKEIWDIQPVPPQRG